MKKILSRDLFRILAVVCGVFGCTLTGYAYDDEAIVANQDFYIYNVANEKYLTYDANKTLMLVPNIDDANTWQFSGTSGDVSLHSGSYYIDVQPAEGIDLKLYVVDPGATAVGAVKLVEGSTWSKPTFSLTGDVNGYTMSITKSYKKDTKPWSSNVSRTFYFANTFYSVQTQSNATKWKVISKRQVDNTISVYPTSIAFETVQGSEKEDFFTISHNGAPTSITISDGTASLVIDNDICTPQKVIVKYRVEDAVGQTMILNAVNGNGDVIKSYTFGPFGGTSVSLPLTVSTAAPSGYASEKETQTITITGEVKALIQQEIVWNQSFTSLTPITPPTPLEATLKYADPDNPTISYEIPPAGSNVVQIKEGKLYVLGAGSTTITASVPTTSGYLAAKKTLNVVVSDAPSTTTITVSNATNTGMYTGTIGGPKEGTFYRGLTEVNLERCFANNYALFDTLYVFGVTMNTDGTLEESYTGTDSQVYTNVPKINIPSASVGCNATTPCYVFEKINSTTYKHHHTFDATKKRFDWTDNQQKNKKIYFTGYCPFAYMGVTPQSQGWMYFTNDGKIDIYLDNCEIMGRFKTQDGRDNGYETFTLTLEADLSKTGEDNPTNCFLDGISSPFVFTSTSASSSEPYKPSIHIAGSNHLKGQKGSQITKVYGKGKLVVEITRDLGINDRPTYSAPIAIKPTNLNQYTHLTMDDWWPTNEQANAFVPTNGYLQLDSEKEGNKEKVVAIDLGSANGSLTINGGQYRLRNSAADGLYTCNLAVGYRRYVDAVSEWYLALYGFGGDIADSKVIINSGTFTMYENMFEKSAGVYYGEAYYQDKTNFLDLRLPAGKGTSLINGGTFNGISNVLMCEEVTTTGKSPINALGLWLAMLDVEAEGTGLETTFTLPFTTVDIEGEIIPVYESNQPKKTIVTSDDLNAVISGTYYGGQSVNSYVKDDKRIVRLLLPGQGCTDCDELTESLVKQWVVALPELHVAADAGEGGSINFDMGGPVEVVVQDEAISYTTNQLLYTDLQGLETCTLTVDLGAEVWIKNLESSWGHITNAEEYKIDKNLNILKAVQADTWYAFTAPFSIHDVAVVETRNDAQINQPEISRNDAMNMQGQDNFYMIYMIRNFLIPSSGTPSPLPLTDLIGTSIGGDELPITHYDGTNIMDANYYLYELENEVFPTTVTGEKLAIKWTPVKRNNAEEPLMYQGKTYAIQFPWCPMCNDLYVDDHTKKRTYYDYWSNKLILFHGNGPQTIAGTNLHNRIVSDAMPTIDATATLAGNSTLADMTLTAQTAYVHNTAKDIFELNDAQYVVKPTEGFLLYNPGAKSMPARISRTGQIEYDENNETSLDGVPTVGDRTSLMLFGAYDGIEVLALHEQLVTVYNLQGNIIFQQYMTAGEQVYVGTGAGVFVVRGESETIKVMVE